LQGRLKTGLGKSDRYDRYDYHGSIFCCKRGARPETQRVLSFLVATLRRSFQVISPAQAAGEWKWVLALLSDMEKVMVEFRAEAAKGLGCYCNKISQKMWLKT